LLLANAAYDAATELCSCTTEGLYENPGSILNDIDDTTTGQQGQLSYHQNHGACRIYL
jgi:hypothetical protein